MAATNSLGHDPGCVAANLGSERDWAFTAEPNPHLNGRSIPLNMGKVLGGGSSINVMVWAAATGMTGSISRPKPETLPGDMNRSSRSIGASRIGRAERPVAARRRRAVFVRSAGDPQPVALAMVEAATALGLPRFESPNGDMMEGRGGVAINDLIVAGDSASRCSAPM